MQEANFPRLLIPVVERQPDHLAVIGAYDGGYRATYAEHLDRVLRLKAAFGRELSLAEQDRFAVLAGNSHRFLELWHAALFGAGVINPLNPRLAASELEFILRDSRTRVIFVDSEHAPVADRLRSTTGIEKVVLLDDGDLPHDIRYEDLVSAHAPAAADEPDEDDVVVLMYTGGTTGTPKGVLLQQRAQVSTIYHMDFMYRYFSHDDVCLLNTPMFHVAGCLGTMGTPAAGNVAVIQRSFDPASTIAAVEEHEVTLLGLVPTMISMLLAHPDFTPEKFRTVRGLAYGGSPMPEALIQRVLEVFPGCELFQVYGMTEMAAVLTCLRTAEHRGERARSAGRALPGVRVEVHDPASGRPVPRGGVGEVVARSGSAMLGYWERPDETGHALRDGWYRTGDMGYLDDDGYLFLTDRLKDMIISGGENVYSTEVENVLSSHPAVQQAAVIGVPSEAWGEAVHAVVVVRDGHEVTEEELIGHARERLAGYKVPKSVELRTEPLPMSAALKVLKRELREEYRAGDRSTRQ
ncbi:long-chain-fatty-acid--CoA ligase [Actinomadura mexicana]|uniref:long-chain-fatty-acid--CoA ligase n=1 Tax=Actinomadura mexicana TaxID=134959 RepID=UPI000B7994FF|nr:long-chain-fatty-acid--CoA ligase [Actinomadura mexicana]